VSRGYRSEAGAWARGSLWGSLVGMSPRAWQAKVRLETERGDRCRVRFDINSTFQVVTDEEQRFYQSELDGALAVARGDSPPDLGPPATAVRAANFRTVGHMTLWALVLGVAGEVVHIVAKGKPLPPELLGTLVFGGMALGWAVGQRKP
jgi:hypothetical protein